MLSIEIKLDNWKKKLLDLGKRNRLINYKETKRSNLNILVPQYDILFDKIVNDESTLVFSYPVNYIHEENDEEELRTKVISGDIETDRNIKEQQQTLKSLRDKARTVMEEQGVNVLYLSFGFLNWSENENKLNNMISPLILVPVNIVMDSITDPYKISIHEDEIVVNPTLVFKLDNDFGIKLPEFDFQIERVNDYLDKITKLVNRSGWTVDRKVSLSLLSFLKINMYYDLNNHSEVIKNNSLIKAFAGDNSEIKDVPDYLHDYNHDYLDRPIDIFQVVDADSSQQDAVILSKKGVSFVLQGPPGTGKSQTITNIISEALADGKKVLFVSEKMAALEVVHKRLSGAGLSDFCLILHSHKANKKQVLKSLEKTLKLDKVHIREEAIFQLDKLHKEREKLNDYCTQLHQKYFPIGKSIYQANAILAKHLNTPDVMFSFENIQDITPQMFGDYSYLVSEFATTKSKMKTDYENNAWRGCKIDRLSFRILQDIELNLNKLMPEITDLENKCIKISCDFKITNEICINQLLIYSEIFGFLGEAPNIPKEWLDNKNLEDLISKANDLFTLKKEYEDLNKYINNKYHNSIFEIDAIKIKNDIFESTKKLNLILNDDKFTNEERIYIKSNQLIELSMKFRNTIEKLRIDSKKICDEFSLDYPKTLNEISKLLNMLDDFSKHILPKGSWFEGELKDKQMKLLCETIDISNCIEKIRYELFETYEKQIVNVDYKKILKRFKTEYTSFFKIFKSNYRSDCKEIKSLKITPTKKITDIEIIELLSKLRILDEKLDWFNTNHDELIEMLGGNFEGLESNFDLILESINAFENIMSYFNGEIPEIIKNYLIEGKSSNLFLDERKALNDLLSNELIMDYIETLNYKLDNNFDITIDTLFKTCNELIIVLNLYNSSLDILRSFLIEDKNILTYKEDICKLSRIMIIENEIRVQNELLKNQYKFLYCGINTDWEEVTSSLIWTAKFVEYIKELKLPKEFIELVVSNNFNEILKERSKYLYEKNNIIEDELNKFNDLFDSEYSVKSMKITELKNKIECCNNNLSGIEEWLDFRNAYKNCESAGLGTFIDEVLDNKIDESKILDVFTKRFYKLWLDDVLPKCPAVYNFRTANQEETIRKFNSLDIEQLHISRLRIQEKIISSLPDVNKITSALDEVGILKRELSKQKKIMPIRKLFTQIPTLLPRLKPCLMMSPLSVSLFLQSDSYNFDIVIFDEASQICTENAIGAIMRAKQVVIAGDTKQLPPTNFFNSSISDGDYDSESEYDDSIAYESILDEAVTVLPEKSLKWHYRSKHEHLIAFSNYKFYNQSLITFPSNVDSIPNNGVEYIFVENGIYDRSIKRNNINEAKKIAELVFNHIETQPNRSLGIITFSEAQQQAVENAVRNLRISNPSYEEYFNEDKDEAFFIKNLENVQGDERDTIIFSIGYAKDSHGVMYMNFGPLSREGGYRRLNVAITRAKYNVKLVGSIHPTDIKLENTNSEGVRMLRSYIEFAINGPRILYEEAKHNNSVNFDSPFEEAVYDFLVEKGFNVSTQVGCSGYRIDLAVKHPTLDGIFVLGVECDGASYHSSRTARERDRLRQTVLEDIGWKIHRVWSTDWIKDPLREGTRLLEAINHSVINYKDRLISKTISNSKDLDNTLMENKYLLNNRLSDIEIFNNESTHFGFEQYIESDIYSISQIDYGIEDSCNVVKYIIDTEFPIHIDLLCKRIAPLFGNQKATSRIRNNVEYTLDKIKNKIIRKNNFLYPINYNKIIPKVANKDKAARNINYISLDEICEAMLLVIEQSVGIQKENLYQIIAKEYGFNRMGPNITSRFDEAFNILKKDNKIKIIENRLSIRN